MPDKIQEEIQKMIKEFIWGRAIAAMKTEDLSKEINQGGRKVMNIKIRNEAISPMWVKDYLRMGKCRPKWAYMADEILRHERPKRAKETLEEIAKWNPCYDIFKPIRTFCLTHLLCYDYTLYASLTFVYTPKPVHLVFSPC